MNWPPMVPIVYIGQGTVIVAFITFLLLKNKNSGSSVINNESLLRLFIYSIISVIMFVYPQNSDIEREVKKPSVWISNVIVYSHPKSKIIYSGSTNIIKKVVTKTEELVNDIFSNEAIDNEQEEQIKSGRNGVVQLSIIQDSLNSNGNIFGDITIANFGVGTISSVKYRVTIDTINMKYSLSNQYN